MGNAANYATVQGWIVQAKEMGATHIISVCDTYSYEDYPVFVMPDDDLIEKKNEYHRVNMQRINEIFTI